MEKKTEFYTEFVNRYFKREGKLYYYLMRMWSGGQVRVMHKRKSIMIHLPSKSQLLS